MSIAVALSAARKYASGGAIKPMTFQGIPIKIETPKGQIREGWTHRLPCDYGYIRHTEGKDGDQIDVFIGPNKDSNKVFIVDQLRRHKDKFDEHKCLVGFDSKKKALAAYKAFYGREYNPHFIGAITELSVNAFKKWIDGGGGKKPVSPEVTQFKKGGTVKATKATANYRVGTKSEHCSICTMFRAPASCTSVQGHIRAQDTCNYFEPKKYQHGGDVTDTDVEKTEERIANREYTPEEYMAAHGVILDESNRNLEEEPHIVDPKAFAFRPEHPWWAKDSYQEGGEVGEDWSPDDIPLPRPRPKPEPPAPFEAGYPQPSPPGTEMKAYHPTWRERLAQGLMGDKPASPAREQFTRGLLGTTGLGEQSFSLSDVTPVGMGLGAQENIQHGKYQQAALSVLPGAAAKTPIGGLAAAAPTAFDPVRRQVLGGIGATVAAGAMPDVLPSAAVRHAAGAFDPLSGSVKIASSGLEAVHHYAERISDELIRTYGNRHDLIANALDKIRRIASEASANAVFDKLPQQIRHGIKTDDAYAAKEAERAAASGIDVKKEALNLADTYGTRYDFIARELDILNRREPTAGDAVLWNLPEQTRIGVMRHRADEWNRPWPGERGYVAPTPEQPRFREITHPEEAKDWLRDHGHDPQDWGYSDPENYVDLANKLKRQEAGLQPPPSDRVPVRTAPSQGAFAQVPLEQEVDRPHHKVIGSLDELFGLVSPHEVEHMSAADLLSIRDKLSAAGADAYHYGEKDPKLWDALHQRFDDLDRDMERHITWVNPRQQEPPLHPAGPFQSSYDQGVVQQFSNYFNDVLGKHFSSQEEFANRYFGGMNTSRISARRGQDPMGSGAPAFYFDGPLMHPNGDFVGSIERTIIPDQKYAYHGLLSLEPKYQGGEIAPKILREQIDAYQKMGLNYVKLNAGLTTGPYAWAKYGWIPEQNAWNRVRSSVNNELISERFKISDPKVKDYLKKVLSDPDPRAIWQLADITAKDDFGNEIGKAALLGRVMRNATNIRFGSSGWVGQLNLKNAESMERFNAYYKRQIEKPKKPKLVP